MERLSVIVSADQKDEIFEFLYFAAGIDRPRGGFLYVAQVSRSTALDLPDVTS